MTPPGRKPKPIEQKVRLGNPGKRALPKSSVSRIAPVGSVIPEPHRCLVDGGDGQVLWRMLWTSGLGWLYQGADSELVLQACEFADERQLLRGLVLADAADWRARAGLRILEKQMQRVLGELGFSPTDRARLGLGEVKKNELHDFREKIAGKRARPD